MTCDPIDTILFDLDGTLVQHGHVLLPEKLAEWGHPRSPAAIEEAFAEQIQWFYLYTQDLAAKEDVSHLWQKMYQRVLAQLAIPDPKNRIRQRMAEFFDAEPVPPLFDDVRPLLRHLPHSWRLGVITQRGRSGAQRFLEGHELSERFPVLIAGDDGFGRKPAPDPFHTALAQLDSHPERAIYVGDRIDDDCGGACNAGLRAFLIDRNNVYSEDIYSEGATTTAAADYVRLNSLLDLLTYLPETGDHRYRRPEATEQNGLLMEERRRPQGKRS